MGRIESVLPVPVPATIPKPRRMASRVPGAAAVSSSRNLVGERGELGAVHAPERRLDVQSERELDRLAGGARGRDDDQPARRARTHERVVVGREVRVANAAEGSLDYRWLYGRRLGPLSEVGRTAGMVEFTGWTPAAPSRDRGGSDRWFVQPPSRAVEGVVALQLRSGGVLGQLSKKTMRALFGRFLIAVAQSVGAGCWLTGTFSSHTRQRPAGG